MKFIKKILLIIGIISILGFVVAWDIADRYLIYSRYIPEKEINEFHYYQTFEKQKKAYEKNYGNPEWNFPKEKTETVKLYENKFLISRITSKTLPETNKTEIIDFFNNPENFDWSETTWNLREAEYILRFYNSNNEEIGKVWLCLEACGMTESIPFSPNMKFGGLSQIGKRRIMEILKLKK